MWQGLLVPDKPPYNKEQFSTASYLFHNRRHLFNRRIHRRLGGKNLPTLHNTPDVSTELILDYSAHIIFICFYNFLLIPRYGAIIKIPRYRAIIKISRYDAIIKIPRYGAIISKLRVDCGLVQGAFLIDIVYPAEYPFKPLKETRLIN